MATIDLARLAVSSLNINGEKIAVTKVLKTKGVAVLADGQRIPLEEIYNKGKGFFYDTPAAAPVKPAAATGRTGGVTPRQQPVQPAAQPAGNSKEVVTFDELEGKSINIDGEKYAVIGFNKRDKIVKLDKGATIPLAEIVRRGRGYVAIEEPAATPAPVKPAPKTPAPAPQASDEIKAAELRGATLIVDGEKETIEKVFESAVKTKEGNRYDRDAIIRGKKGTFVLVEEEEEQEEEEDEEEEQEEQEAPKKPNRQGGISRRAETAKPSKAESLDEIDIDTAEEIQEMVEEAAKAQVSSQYDLQFVRSGGACDGKMVRIEVVFALSSLSEKQIKALIAKYEAEQPKVEEEEEEAEEDFNDLDRDLPADDFEEEEEQEEEEQEEQDIESRIDSAVEALTEEFGARDDYRDYVEAYFDSEEVEQAFGDDMEPGVTRLHDKANNLDLTLVGYAPATGSEKSAIVLVNESTGKLRKVAVAKVARMEEIE